MNIVSLDSKTLVVATADGRTITVQDDLPISVSPAEIVVESPASPETPDAPAEDAAPADAAPDAPVDEAQPNTASA